MAGDAGMTQNTSHAVMAQRSEPPDSLDFFPTPPWATRALCEWIERDEGVPGILKQQKCWEPACGQGHMARPLAEYFSSVWATDVHDYGFGGVQDFLFPSKMDPSWIITNPPFRLGEQFAKAMIERCENGCAILVRTAFLESTGRLETLFGPHPPTDILQFSERVAMVKGRYDPKASTATAYCWIVWRKRAPAKTLFHWIPQCRKRLEKAYDYEVAA